MRDADASQGARRGPQDGEDQDDRGGERQTDDRDARWQAINADLISIKEGLEKEEDINPRFARELSRVIACVTLAHQTTRSSMGIEARLGRIEQMLRAPTTSAIGTTAPGTTWARVAATGMR